MFVMLSPPKRAKHLVGWRPRFQILLCRDKPQPHQTLRLRLRVTRQAHPSLSKKDDPPGHPFCLLDIIIPADYGKPTPGISFVQDMKRTVIRPGFRPGRGARRGGEECSC